MSVLGFQINNSVVQIMQLIQLGQFMYDMQLMQLMDKGSTMYLYFACSKFSLIKLSTRKSVGEHVVKTTDVLDTIRKQV